MGETFEQTSEQNAHTQKHTYLWNLMGADSKIIQLANQIVSTHM